MMLYEIRWRHKNTEDQYSTMPKREITTDGQHATRVAGNLTVMSPSQEFMVFSTQVDDRTWVPVS